MRTYIDQTGETRLPLKNLQTALSIGLPSSGGLASSILVDALENAPALATALLPADTGESRLVQLYEVMQLKEEVDLSRVEVDNMRGELYTTFRSNITARLQR